MLKPLLFALVLLTGYGSASAAEIYSTFSDDENALFDCCNTAALAGAGTGAKTAVGIPFVAPASGEVARVDLALSHTEGIDDFFWVSVRVDHNGRPGPALGKAMRSDIPAGGQCCVYQSVTFTESIPLEAGVTYWVVAKTKSQTAGGWNLNVIGVSGAYAVSDDEGHWGDAVGVLPVLRVTER